MPRDNDIAGWVNDTSESCLTGIAKEESELYDIIDGGAEVYLYRDWVSSAYRGYTDHENVICVQIYDQNSNDSALSLYKATEEGDYDEVPSIGENARVKSLVFVYEFEIIKSHYFIRISTKNSKEDAVKNKAIEIAKLIVSKIK